MFFHFRNTTKTFPMAGEEPAPTTPEGQQALIDALQDDKTNRYKKLVEEKAVARPGVVELMDEALADPTIAVGVCSASTKAAAQRTLDITLGQDRIQQLDVVILGDDVSEKKPSPLIYNEAAKRIGLPSDRCVVIEDSMIGLLAAKGAVSLQYLRCSEIFRFIYWTKAALFDPTFLSGNEVHNYLHRQYER